MIKSQDELWIYSINNEEYEKKAKARRSYNLPMNEDRKTMNIRVVLLLIDVG